MRLRALILLVPVLAAALAACGGNDRRAAGPTAAVTPSAPVAAAPALSGGLAVFAAASLTDAFTEIGREFTRANPRVTVTFNFAASTTLRIQIEQGAKAGVFASADQVQMDKARAAGVIDGHDRLFAKNTLVVIVPAANPGKVGGIEDLARPGLKLVLAERHVPVGAYARAALAKMSADPRLGAGFGERVLANLRSEEANVRAVVTKVQLGEADAGIVYASDVTAAVAQDVASLPIPDRFNSVATYPIAAVRDVPNAAAARAFIAFVRSAQGQAILRKHRFVVDQETGSASAPPASPPPAGGRQARPAAAGTPSGSGGP